MNYALVTIYSRHGMIYIVPSVRDHRGMQVHSEPVIALRFRDREATEIGERIRWASSSAMAQGKPDPTCLLRKANLATWSTFMEDSKSCILQIYEDSIKLRATENDGKGFGPVKTVPPVVLSKDVDHRTLSDAVISLLEQAL